MQKWINLLVFCVCVISAKAQFLFSESFVMIPLDTAKKYAGTISGSFSQQTQKYVVTQLGSRVELAQRINKVNVLTLAGNFQMVRNGGENILSGGYAYARFRERINRQLYPEFTAQFQWLEARGLEQKFATTANMRYRFIRNEKLAVAAAAGLVMEYEKWGYSGVRDENLPANTNPKEVFNPRFNSYISYNHKISEMMNLDMAMYYQFRTDSNFSRKRLGAHSRLNLKLTETISYALTLKLMNEYEPVVPIDKVWYHYTNELVLYF